MTQSAIEKSFDNLTIVMVSFKNLLNYYTEKPEVNLNTRPDSSNDKARTSLPRIAVADDKSKTQNTAASGSSKYVSGS